MKIIFSEDRRYPTIAVPPPYELVGEFLKALHTTKSVSPLVKIVSEVITGQTNGSNFPQDDALLTLNHDDGIAHIWVNDLSMGMERTMEMPLSEFAEILDQWFDYLKSRESLTN